MPVEHNPYDTPERVALRKGQDDPIVMYLVVKESLQMGAGKVGAQCGHAVQLFMLRFMKYWVNEACDEPPEELARCALAKEWIETSFRKVVLRASDTRFERVKQELPCFLVRDAGLTEVPQGSETVLCLWPMRKSQAPKLISKLQTL